MFSETIYLCEYNNNKSDSGPPGLWEGKVGLVGLRDGKVGQAELGHWPSKVRLLR